MSVPKFVRYAELEPKYGIPFSRTHIRRLIDAELFPAPVHLGPSTIAWPEDDILAYRDRVRAERDAKHSARRAAAREAGGGHARAS